MGFFEDLANLFGDVVNVAVTPTTGIVVFPPETADTTPTPEQVMQARIHLLGTAAAVGAITAAPALYALSLRKGRRKRKLTEKEILLGETLENASKTTSSVLVTALASPAIATAAGYILIQKLEDARLIRKGLGDAAQTLLAAQAAGPMIGGLFQGIGSAFGGMRRAPKTGGK